MAPLLAIGVIGTAPGAATASTGDPPIITAPLPLALPDADATVAVAAIDPLQVDDDDFIRHRDPALWAGLSVQRIGFREGEAGWRFWRIVNPRKPAGPLWVVTHDNENATFAAALDGVRSWGGVAIVVDTQAADSGYAARFNRDSGGAKPIDPNRNFREAQPLYAARVLRDLVSSDGLIVALHTNAAGFDPALKPCPGQPRSNGSGDISVRLCTSRFSPRSAARPVWPFDTEDTLALVPHLAGGDPFGGFCARQLAALDFNIVYERVGQSDGSLSNYAAQHGIDYINFETRDLGDGAPGIAQGRDRLVRMIDRMMDRCAPIGGLALHPEAQRRRR